MDRDSPNGGFDCTNAAVDPPYQVRYTYLIFIALLGVS